MPKSKKEPDSAGSIVIVLALMVFAAIGFIYATGATVNYVTHKDPIISKPEDKPRPVIHVGDYKYFQFFDRDVENDRIYFANVEKHETVKKDDGRSFSRYTWKGRLMINEFVQPEESGEEWMTEEDAKSIWTPITDSNELASFLCTNYPSDKLHTNVRIMMQIPENDPDFDDYLVKTEDNTMLLMDNGCDKVEIIK